MYTSKTIIKHIHKIVISALIINNGETTVYIIGFRLKIFYIHIEENNFDI